MMEDFNSKQAHCESRSTTGWDKSWGNKLLSIIMDDTINDSGQKRTHDSEVIDSPAWLDLLIKNEADIIREIKFERPMGESKHVTIDFEVKEARNEPYMTERFNCGKSNFENLRRYVEKADWSSFVEGRNMKNSCCLRPYNEAVMINLHRVTRQDSLKKV